MKKIALLVTTSLVLSGCSILSKQNEIQAQVNELLEKSTQVPQALLTINVAASSTINPNLNGIPSPLEIRIYQLKESGAFNQSDFLPLYTDAQGVLKAAMISSRHLPSAFPGRSYDESFSLNIETKFIGVVAGFSNYQQAKNKAIYSIEEFKDSQLNIYLDGLNLTLANANASLSQRQRNTPVNVSNGDR